MSESVNYIMLDGSCLPEEEAVIPAVTSGLYYGAGCFETFLTENGSIFKFKDHIDRLNRGLKYLGALDKQTIDGELILHQIKTLLAKNNLCESRSRVRIQVSMAEKGGYSKRNDSSIIVIISTKLTTETSDPKKLILSETRVIPSSARPANLKLSNMLHYRQAFRVAVEKGADDAVMMNGKGFIAETSIANIFWMKDDRVFTPSNECDILPGIMRHSIIEIIRNKMPYEITEGKFRMDELMKANSVWLTNSVFEFVPVLEIENTSFRVNHDFFSDLKKKLEMYKQENNKKYA